MPNIIDQDFTDFFTKQRKCTLSLLCNRYGLIKEDAEEVYQNACVVLWQNINDGKLVDLTCRLSTYFTSICINQALKQLRNKDIEIVVDENQFYKSKVDMILDITGQDDLTERKHRMLHNLLKQLNPPCDDILWYYYGYEMKMSEIADIIGYADANSVKSKKCQCMKRLNTVLNEKVKRQYGNLAI